MEIMGLDWQAGQRVGMQIAFENGVQYLLSHSTGASL